MKSKSVAVNVTANGLAAKTAHASANNALNLANDAQRTADGKNSVYRGLNPSTIPTAGLKAGDLYFTDNALYTWTGSAWEKTVSDTTGAEIRAQVEAAVDEGHKSVERMKSNIESEVKELDASVESIRANAIADTNRVASDLSAAKESLKADVSKMASDVSAAKASLSAVSNDLSATKESLADTGNRLAMATSEFQKKTGQLSGSLSTANSKIEFNSNAIAEVKHTAEEISTTVSSMKAGDRNIARGKAGGKDWFSFTGFNGTTNQHVDLVSYSLSTLKAGDKVTFGITMKNEGVTSGTMYFQQHGNVSEWNRDYGGISPKGNVTDFVPNGAEKALTYTITITSGMLNGNSSYILQVRTDNVPAGGKLSFRYGFVKKGTMATDWTPAPEDTDQAISTVSQTADAIRADLTNTKGDVASVKATANSFQSQIIDNKNNISSVKQTASGLTSRVGNAEGSISQLQQTASGLTSTVSNLHAGDRNYIRGTSSDWANLTDFNNKTNYCLQLGTFYLGDLKEGDQITLGITLKNAGITSGQMILFQGNGDVKGWTFGANASYDIAKWLPAGQTREIRIIKTLSANDVANNTIQLQIRTDYVPAGGTLSAKCVYIKRGTLATDWSPAPEDTDSSISQIKQTADRIQTQVNDNKGNVSSLQQTATMMQKQITDNKGNISSVKNTADAVRTDLTNAKGDISTLQSRADSLTSSITNANGQISTLQQRADSLTSTLSNGGTNLLSGTSGELKRVTVTSWWSDYTSLFKSHILDNKTCTARVWIDKPSKDCVLQVWTNGSGFWVSNTIKANQSGYVTVTFKITNTSYTDGHIAIGSGSGTVTFGYKELQIEYGNTATPWKPSNGDISSLQQTANSIKAYVKESKGSKTLASLLSMDPNKSTIAQVVNGKPIAAINMSSEGNILIDATKLHITAHTAIDDASIKSSKIESLSADKITTGTLDADHVRVINLDANSITTGRLNGKNVQLDGDTKVTGRLDLMQDKANWVSQDTSYHNNWSWNNAHIYFDNYLQLLGENCTVFYDNTNTRLNGGKAFYSISTLTPGYLKLSTYTRKVGDAEFDGQITRSYLDSSRLETPEIYTDKFQVWRGIALGTQTIGSPTSDIYFQQGNVDDILREKYSNAKKVLLHCDHVASQSANTVTSKLSTKTAITKVTYNRALMAVQNTDMYDYKYVADDSGQHYVSGIIDDIHDKPEYNMDPMLINQERTARIDANLLGYHHVVLQEILKRLDKLEAK